MKIHICGAHTINGTLILYTDDLIIPSEGERERLEKLEIVFGEGQMSGLRIKWERVKFYRKGFISWDV